MKLEQLNEVLSSPVKYVWNVKSPKVWKGVFKIGDVDYEMWIINAGNITGEPYWEIGFKISNIRDISSQQLTGTGKELQVFSTVIKMIFDFAKNIKPNEMRIAANTTESKREQLYRRLLNKFTANSGYRVEEDNIKFIKIFKIIKEEQ